MFSWLSVKYKLSVLKSAIRSRIVQQLLRTEQAFISLTLISESLLCLTSFCPEKFFSLITHGHWGDEEWWSFLLFVMFHTQFISFGRVTRQLLASWSTHIYHTLEYFMSGNFFDTYLKPLQWQQSTMYKRSLTLPRIISK